MVAQDPSHQDIQVALICALPLEYDAVILLLENSTSYGAGDRKYKIGYIAKQKVVLSLLSNQGKAVASSAASIIGIHFPSIKLAFLVGVCGGVPTSKQEVLLGDVVISDEIVQYDFGKQHPNATSANSKGGNQRLKPHRRIYDKLGELKTEGCRKTLRELAAGHLKTLQGNYQGTLKDEDTKTDPALKSKYNYPGAAKDRLFDPSYWHMHRAQAQCTICSGGKNAVCEVAQKASCAELNCEHGIKKNLVTRKRLTTMLKGENIQNFEPTLHVGNVGSADTIMKSGKHRDDLAKSNQIIAFEMEGAGIGASIDCIVIKGVSDYADSHKCHDWQNFAAATAASALKAILEYFEFFQPIAADSSSKSVAEERKVENVPKYLPKLVQIMTEDLTRGLQWYPSLTAVPSVICDMAVCFAAGKSETTKIKLTVPIMEINGVTIRPVQCLDENLKECSDLGSIAFNETKQNMIDLQRQIMDLTGKTGPLAEIFQVLSTPQPVFSRLKRPIANFTRQLAKCQTEASTARNKFEFLVKFIDGIKSATVKELAENTKRLQEKQGNDDAKAARGEYDDLLKDSKKERDKLGGELDIAEDNCEAALRKMKKALNEGPGRRKDGRVETSPTVLAGWRREARRIQARVHNINSRLQNIGQSGQIPSAAFGFFFRVSVSNIDSKEEESNTDKQKGDLQDKLKELHLKRKDLCNADQIRTMEEYEECQRKLIEAGNRHGESLLRYKELQIQSRDYQDVLEQEEEESEEESEDEYEKDYEEDKGGEEDEDEEKEGEEKDEEKKDEEEEIEEEGEEGDADTVASGLRDKDEDSSNEDENKSENEVEDGNKDEDEDGNENEVKDDNDKYLRMVGATTGLLIPNFRLIEI
ncbi:hypothetical protein TWF481_012127 [Arthrobotrys musiformis]|uniref:Nucleoside phosphorylase domain-containing protein n=1 Tax=Arthrobotrys musiformis TaxID=47236 RepID=A0AAV9VW65_9PEZI